MSNGIKRGWLYAAMFVAVGLCAVTISMAAVGRTHTGTSDADNSSSACTARSNEVPSMTKAPSTDDTAYRRRQRRRRTV
jgi:hypothetical protein